MDDSWPIPPSALRPRLKVLFMTGYAENAVLSHWRPDLGIHVLTKPFSLEALASRIQLLLSSGSA